MSRVEGLTGFEVLDSRGRPTVQATCLLSSGASGTASMPSGESKGSTEALELRDGDPRRYRGLGCRQAVQHIDKTITQAAVGRDFASQRELDTALLALDGTPNKSRLGANTTLAVSIAFARAVAAESNRSLFAHLADIAKQVPRRLPMPEINLFSGGKHAGNQVSIQDVLVVPLTAQSIDEALTMTFEVYQAAASLIAREYHARALVADEGGLAPEFPDSEAMLEAAVAAIASAGLQPGRDVGLAVDIAASHFFSEGQYRLGEQLVDAEGMIDCLCRWVDRYPLLSIEDGLAEEDWTNWPLLKKRIGDRALVVGDDLLTTSPGRIRRAIDARAADALLLKVNQIGTLTEALDALQLARSAGWQVIISARSGETEDDWLADLAVGWSADQIKVGSITRSERLAKYNRLLAIEASTGLTLRQVD